MGEIRHILKLESSTHHYLYNLFYIESSFVFFIVLFRYYFDIYWLEFVLEITDTTESIIYASYFDLLLVDLEIWSAVHFALRNGRISTSISQNFLSLVAIFQSLPVYGVFISQLF